MQFSGIVIARMSIRKVYGRARYVWSKGFAGSVITDDNQGEPMERCLELNFTKNLKVFTSFLSSRIVR